MIRQIINTIAVHLKDAKHSKKTIKSYIKDVRKEINKPFLGEDFSFKKAFKEDLSFKKSLKESFSFKKIFDESLKSLDRGKPFNPAILNDSVARQTKWFALESSSSSTKTHQLFQISTTRIEFKASIRSMGFCFILVSIGLITLARINYSIVPFNELIQFSLSDRNTLFSKHP